MKFNNILKILLTISLAGLSCSPVLATSDSKIDIAKILKDMKEKKEKEEKETTNNDKKDDNFAKMLEAIKEKRKKEKEEKKDKDKKDDGFAANMLKAMKEKQNKENLRDAKTNNKNYRTFEIKFGSSPTDSYKYEVLLAIGELFKVRFKNLNSSLADELFKDAPDVFITDSKSNVGGSKIVEIPFFCENFFSEDNGRKSPQNITKYKQCSEISTKLKADLRNLAKDDKLTDSEVVTKDGKKIKVSKGDIKNYINKIWTINVNVKPSVNKDDMNDHVKGDSSTEKGLLSNRSSEKRSESNVIDSKLKSLQEKVENLEKKYESLSKKYEKLKGKIKKTKNKNNKDRKSKDEGKKIASLPF